MTTSLAERWVVIETDRLILRPFEAGDFDAYCAIRANPAVARWLPGGEEAATEAPARTRALFDEAAVHWQVRRYGIWAVVLKETGSLIGHCGLRHLDEFDETEVLYSLDDAHWRRGYASEAAMASLGFGFVEAGLDTIMAITLDDNLGSRGVMEKIGMDFAGTTSFKGYEVVQYRCHREPWLAAHAAGRSVGG